MTTEEIIERLQTILTVPSLSSRAEHLLMHLQTGSRPETFWRDLLELFAEYADHLEVMIANALAKHDQ